jgi:hypothetical protein
MNLHPQFQHLLSNLGAIPFNGFGHNASERGFHENQHKEDPTFLWAA